MILRLLLGAGIGGGVSWYLGKRDQQSLMRSAGLGAGAMLVSPLLMGGSGGAFGGDLGAAAGSSGFYKDEGGYAWYYDGKQKFVAMLASPKGGPRVVWKKAEPPDKYGKVWQAVVKGKSPVDDADGKSAVLAYAAARGGIPTGKAGAVASGKAAGASAASSSPGTEVAAPAPEGDVVDKAAAMIGITRQQLYIGAGVLVGGIGAALYFGSQGSRSARMATVPA
jgi:hypothetical protein